MARLRTQSNPSGHIVLVVDDDPTILSTLERLLAQEGHQVLTALGGREAMRLCREYSPHLILLDYFMPDLTGEEVVRLVRAFDSTVQIVLQTGYASEKPAREMLRELEIQGYHDKSEGPEKLLVWVDTALKAYRQLWALKASRDGLNYILKATPDLHRLQPMDDLMQGVLTQLQGLLGLAGTFLATAPEPSPALEGSFLATVSEQQFKLRVATGRFSNQNWENLSPEERSLVLQAAKSGQIQTDRMLALPLLAGERTVGVVVAEQAFQGSNLELLSIFANQAAVAIENVWLYELATRDDLTKLFNRRHWLQRLDDTLRLAHRHGQPTSVLVLDIDHFKAINDRYGHLAGDRILAVLGQCVLENLRKTDLAGRYGGEEITTVLPLTDSGGAFTIAEKLRTAIAGLEVPWEGESLRFTVSIGVASLTIPGPYNPRLSEDLLTQARQNLIKAADEALYAAKRQGRNRVVLGQTLELSTRLTEVLEA